MLDPEFSEEEAEPVLTEEEREKRIAAFAELRKLHSTRIADDTTFLNFKEHEEVPYHTWIFALENGTNIYFYGKSQFYYDETKYKQRLYVKLQGKEVDAVLPDIQIEKRGAFGNTFYFASERQIYTAIFDTRGGWKVSYLRDRLHGEEFHENALCVRKRDDGNLYAYRMSEDPDRDGIRVDNDLERWRGLRLQLLHRQVLMLDSNNALVPRSKALYATYNKEGPQPFAKTIGDNVINIKIAEDYESALYAPEPSNPLLYFAFNCHLYVLDTDSVKFLPSFWMGDYFVHQIVSVCNGLMTFIGSPTTYTREWGEKAPGNMIITAQLPSSHFNAPEPANHVAKQLTKCHAKKATCSIM